MKWFKSCWPDNFEGVNSANFFETSQNKPTGNKLPPVESGTENSLNYRGHIHHPHSAQLILDVRRQHNLIHFLGSCFSSP